ncbi:4-hydroxy-3-methylbut-2-enyl diphosphate reductase [uncultured Mobiluncus sp.]|uniref:4-hydroxy-3-methylbut-2-enyl diphosphate reductase n=1 Tax=uncultured Mobiluncus sp. TaxID=293425 RepID=UPI00260F20C7|nr:4-hydroxy-3-methylbut-2-enyl diphosphate reductase [uncultured Mobiluncus sp.]
MGKVLLASPRGYCAGVDRAVTAVQRALEVYGQPIYVRKEIVHNKFVVRTLADAGAIFVDELSEVPPGSRVVFSAHGVAPSVYAEAEQRGLEVIDATCPLVSKVHREARRYANEGYDIILIGHAGHEEVEGTLGVAPDKIHVIDTDWVDTSLPGAAGESGDDTVGDTPTAADPLAGLSTDPDALLIWLSQTTLSVDQTAATVQRLQRRFPGLISPPSDDICFATQNRQGAVKAMAPQCEVVVVVGSANSSNSVRLREVALQSGAGAAYRVEGAHELNPDWFAGAKTIGVTSGASVPEVLVTEVLEWLAQRGFDEVQTVQTTQETTSFSLPKPLR